MSSLAVRGTTTYKVISVYGDYPVGIDYQGPGPDQDVHLTGPCSSWVVDHVSSTLYDAGLCGYPYTGVEQHAPGMPVIATDNKDYQVTWQVDFKPEDNAYIIRADYDPTYVWTVEAIPQKDGSRIVVDPLQSALPDTQLFRFEKVE